jgi:hypothetical protein
MAKELLLLSASGSEKAKRFGRVASVAIDGRDVVM